MKRLRYLLRIILWLAVGCQDSDARQFSFASRPVRDSITASLVEKVDACIAKPINQQTLNEWKGACWAMELMLYKPSGLKERLPGILDSLHQQPPHFQQSLLEMLLTLFPGEFSAMLQKNWMMLGNNKVKAMALEQLALAGDFPNLDLDTAFQQSDYAAFYLRRWKGPAPVFPKKDDLLDKHFLPAQTLLLSFQYRNRDKPGCLMIRTADHQWLSDAEGKPFCFTQLARSITNMPWYLTNGNTPQGLHRILGTGVSNNNWIGPTPNLQLVMPLESADQPFFADTLNAYEQYQALLGPLGKFPGLYESYHAGRIGRSEIIAHGTTIPEWYYTHQPYYPCTPSLGCLCSPEIWSGSGTLEESVQQQWMDIVARLEPKPVYLLVVEWGE